MTTGTDVRRLALRTLMPGFVGVGVPPWLATALDDGLGSVCIYGPNVTNLDQLRALCADLHGRSPGVVLATDEEGGDVTRLHYLEGSPYVGNAVLGRLDDLDVTRAEAARIAADLVDVGIDLDLAPVVDVNSADDNPVIGTRSFGADVDVVARHTRAWVESAQATGIAVCAKHFPGHGDTVTDSHVDLPVVDVTPDVLRSRELAPFRSAVDAGVRCVMTAAIVVPALDPGTPATFSSVLLEGVLRGELGFGGVIVSDALDMAGASAETGIPEAAVRALVAGCDLLCLGSQTPGELVDEVVDEVVAAVEHGRLSRSRLKAAAARVGALSHAVRAGGRTTVVASRPDVVPAFALSDAARAWLAADGPVAVVQVETDTNVAVGRVPWGPSSVGGVTSASELEGARRVAVVGRDIGADHPAWAVADDHRAARRDVVVVDCGWPRGGADIVTWGGSPAVAQALVDLVTGRRAAT